MAHTERPASTRPPSEPSAGRGEDVPVTPPSEWDALRALRPDAVCVRRVRAAWSAMPERHRRFVLQAVRDMDSLLPAAHPLTPSSGSTAGLEVLDALIDGVEARHDPAALEQAWLELGWAHAEAGLAGLDYRPLGHAVFRAAHEVFADVWSTALGSSWVAYYVWVSGWVAQGSRYAQDQLRAAGRHLPPRPG